MEQKTLFVIFILILISSQLWTIIWDIGKAAFYLVILLLVITYVDPDTAEVIRNYGKRILGLDTNLITDSLSGLSKFIFGIVGKQPNKILEKSNKILTETTSEIFGKQEMNQEMKPKTQSEMKQEMKSKTKSIKK